MKCVLVSVHFTSPSTNAARYAADLAVNLDAELRLLFVNCPGLESLSSLAEELRERTRGKIPIHADLRTGKKEECVRLFCKAAKPFLVVTDGPLRMRLSCPVLNVPGNALFQGLRSVVVACDRNDILSGMVDHLPFLTDLYYFLGCRFELVHVIRDDENSVGRIFLEYNNWRSRPAFFPERLNFLRKDEPREGISEYLRSHHADCLMVLPKTHSWIEFHESQARNISEACELPVLNVYE